MRTDNLIATVAVGVVAAAALAAALMAHRPDTADAAVAAAGHISSAHERNEVVTAPPLKKPPASTDAAARNSAQAMGAAPVCRECGVVQMVVAVQAHGQSRAEAYQMHIRMDDGSHRTVQQRGALAAGSRVLLEGDTVRVLSDAPGPG